MTEHVVHPEVADTRKGLTRNIAEVMVDMRKRKNNGLDTEDQDWRLKNLREARNRIN